MGKVQGFSGVPQRGRHRSPLLDRGSEEAVLEEKVDVARSVSWAIKDITENLGGDGITSVFHRTSLPERFVLHWCKRDKVCICDLIGWKVGKEA